MLAVAEEERSGFQDSVDFESLTVVLSHLSTKSLHDFVDSSTEVLYYVWCWKPFITLFRD